MIKLFKHQNEFLYSQAIHTGLIGGFGSGKTFTGTLKALSKKMAYPGIDVAYYLPTYRLIKDIAVPRFEELLKLHRIQYDLNKQDMDFITPFGKIIMRSMDNPDLIVGYEVGYSLIDEADILATTKMFKVLVKVLARNRARLPDGLPNMLDFVSTPEGYKFLWKFFVKDKKPSRHLINAKTSDNRTLSDSYISTLLESYTPEQVRAYLDGEFVNITTGTVYNLFNREANHSTRTIKKGESLHIGMDFNVTNMSAIVHVFDGNIPTAVEELVKIYDTPAMAQAIKERFPNHSITIYPDASGQNRNTSGKSDIKILKKAGFTVRALKSNPLIRDRVNAVNLAFYSHAIDKRSYFINTHNCPVYTEGIEQQSYKDGVPDKTTGYDHVTDAGGYFIYGHGYKRKQSRILRQ